MTDEIRKKLWNIELVVEDIKKFPQTYNTILKDLTKNGTCQTILRRKMNKLVKDGFVFKTSIPGTRFGKLIFFYIPKKYSILIESNRTGSKVFCFFKHEKISKYYIKINDYWILEDGMWIKKDEEKIFFEGNILKFI